MKTLLIALSILSAHGLAHASSITISGRVASTQKLPAGYLTLEYFYDSVSEDPKCFKYYEEEGDLPLSDYKKIKVVPAKDGTFKAVVPQTYALPKLGCQMVIKQARAEIGNPAHRTKQLTFSPKGTAWSNTTVIKCALSTEIGDNYLYTECRDGSRTGGNKSVESGFGIPFFGSIVLNIVDEGTYAPVTERSISRTLKFDGGALNLIADPWKRADYFSGMQLVGSLRNSGIPAGTFADNGLGLVWNNAKAGIYATSLILQPDGYQLRAFFDISPSQRAYHAQKCTIKDDVNFDSVIEAGKYNYLNGTKTTPILYYCFKNRAR